MSKYDNAGLVMIPSGYKASKVYSVIPNTTDGDFDFTRASTATRVNKDGLIEVVASNVPRLDYPFIDGVVQDCPSLLLEPSRTNLFLYSESLESSWVASGINPIILTASQFISPDGTQNASRLQIPSTNTVSIWQQLFSHTSGTQYTISAYVKSNVSTNQQFKLYGDYGTPTGISGVLTATSEWQRFSFTYTATGTGTRSGGFYYVPNTQADLQIYAIQVEQGSYPTSYIPTSGSTVTRVAETCNGAGNADTFNGSEGVLFAEISALANDLTERVISLQGASSSDRVSIQYNTITNQIKGFVRVGGTFVASLEYTVTNITDFHKVALKYKSNDFQLWIDGVLREGDVSGVTFAANTLIKTSLDIGGVAPFYGNTKQLMTFNKALTDAELEDLTSWDSFLEMATSQLYTIN